MTAQIDTSLPLFSVVVRCDGEGENLTTAIESLWAQRFDNLEVIAVNHSRRSTRELLDALAARSPKPMKVIEVAGAGARASLDAGAAIAAAPYLAFLDDDDAYEPDRLEGFARVVKEVKSFVWGFSGVEPIDRDGEHLELTAVQDPRVREQIRRSTVPLLAIRTLVSTNAAVTAGNLVVKADVFNHIGATPDLESAEDWDVVQRLNDICRPYIVERALYRRRIDPPPTSSGSRSGGEVLGADSKRIAREHQSRVAASALFVPLGRGPRAYLEDLDPDDARAMGVGLWVLRKLRAIPLAYPAARRAARFFRLGRRRLLAR